MDDYRDSHKSTKKPEDYDQKFWTPGTPEYLFWQIERQILEGILTARPNRPKLSLDFACGTGRVLSWSQTQVDQCTGVDVSSAMLSVARERCPEAEIHEADITQNDDVVAGPFDLITSFRFFLNAQEELRHEALAALRKRLAPEGLLAVNFHLNPLSPTGAYIGARSRIAGNPRPIATVSKARKLLEAHDLDVVSVHGYAYMFYRRPTLLFPNLTARVERTLARWNLASRFASHFIITGRPRS